MAKLTLTQLAAQVNELRACITAQADLIDELRTQLASRPVQRSMVTESYAQRKQRLAAFISEHFPTAAYVNSADLAAAGWVQ